MTDAIVVDNVSKTFRIPLDRSTTLKYRATHWRSASRYNVLDALRGVSFTVPEGQFIGIIGRNGSGKSTLLKILSKIYEPSTGRIAVNGAVSPFLELGVGFNPELTARENVFLNGAILGIGRAELRKRVDDIIAFAEVTRFADTKLKNYSSGMQVRLAFSVAIQANAGILLMDEVLAVGDAAFQQRCFDIFAQYKRDGRTVVLVTHDLGAVSSYCDRALLIDQGLLIADGRPHTVVEKYRRMVGDAQEQRDAAGSGTGTRPWGSGEVGIDSVEVLGPDGTRHSVLRYGEPVCFRLNLHGHARGPEVLTLTIGVSRADGLEVSAMDTRNQEFLVESPAPGEEMAVEWRVPSLPLGEGAYMLTATVTDDGNGHMLSRWESAAQFHVQGDGLIHGLVDLGGTWALASGRVAERRPA